MKYKLTNVEINALKMLFEAMVVRDFKCTNYYEKLLQSLMLALYKKIYMQSILVRRQYSITFSEEVAVAFVLFWSEFDLSLAPFEDNLIRKIIMAIDEKMAGSIQSPKALSNVFVS